MGFLDAFLHLLSFVAPAFAVALLVSLTSRWILPRLSYDGPWWRLVAINFVVGVLVLVAGLGYFGVDGKMATYAALVVAVATSQWLWARAWKG